MRICLRHFADRLVPPFDVIVTSLLGLSLCGLLLSFVAIRLSARDWWPIRYGLSEDGSIYVSLCAGGLRAHDVQTGKEIDRITLRGPWRDFTKPPENGLVRLHPLDEANAESFHYDKWRNDDGEEDSRTRPRMQVSKTGRYVAALFPAGYLILWDRQRARIQLLEAPEYFLHEVSLAEKEGLLRLECTPRPLHQSETLKSIAAKQHQYKESEALTVLTYGLDSLVLQATTIVPNAGEPINGDCNCRFIDDVEKKEVRIAKWSNFPSGQPQIAHQITYREYPNAVLNPWQRKVRVVDGRLDLISFHDNFVSFRAHPEGKTIHRTRLPEQIQEISLDWTANGSASFANGARSDTQIIATWDLDGSIGAFEFPLDCTLVTELPEKVNNCRFLRVASDEGRIIDLPIGKSGELHSKQLDLTAFPYLPHEATAVVVALGYCWCVYAWRRNSLLSNRGWQIIALLACCTGFFWGVELQMSRAPYGFLICSLIWLTFGLLAVISGVTSFLKGNPIRSFAVCVCAIFAMLLLCEIPSRQSSDKGRVTKVFHGSIF